MANTDTDQQLASLRLRIGEPSDSAQARFSVTQLLDFLNEARRRVAAATRAKAISDSQTVTPPASGSPAVYSVSDDFIWFEELTYDGRPMRLVRPQDWRDVIGSDDTVIGQPTVAMYHARQIHLFNVPSESGLTLAYRGWAYSNDLVSGGVEADFIKGVTDITVWRAAAFAKAADERSNSFEFEMAREGYGELKNQYNPRGPRYVRTGDLYMPWRPLA